MKITFRCPPELEGRIPKPYPAKRGLPDWLKDMGASAHSSTLQGEIRTVKHCPPFIDAMGFGFMVPLVTDIRVAAGKFEWSWDPGPSSVGGYTRSPLSFHVSDQVVDTPFHEEDTTVVKFTNYWTIETEPGYSLLVTHPFNREDLPYLTLSGLVDTDRYRDGCIQFPVLWRDLEFSGVLERGTPVAQCIPVTREQAELEFGTLVGEHAERFTEVQEAVNRDSGTYRKRFRVAKP